VNDRRKYPRIPVSENAVLSLLDGPDAGRAFDVQIVNVSGNGIGLLVDNEVRKGADVRILAANHMIIGKVAYCRPEGGVYSVGVTVDEACEQVKKLLQGAFLQV
jgi:hypothetical protein